MSDVLEYASATRSPSVFVFPAAMIIRSGAPSLVGTSDSPRWFLDPAAVEELSFDAVIPAGWSTLDVYFWWAPTDGSAGAARLLVRHASGAVQALTTGAAYGACVTASAADVASPGVAAQITRSKVTIGPLASGSGGPIRMTAAREGSHANDTYAADIALLAVELFRIS